MKLKKFLASTLLTVSLAANANNWIMVQEADNGNRLIVDIETFMVTKGDDNTPLVAAIFSYVEDGKLGEPFAFVTDLKSCTTRNGLIHHRMYDGVKWNTVQRYFWSKNGRKMYDAGGMALCDMLEVKVRQPTKGSGT